MKDPKSDLDEDEEDARVSAVLCPLSPVAPSLALRTWGCEGGPKV
jgi:hypothetical protein